MPEWFGIVLLYAIGCVLLIVEFFLPAHGLLGLVGLAVLGYGWMETMAMDRTAGLIALAALVVVLPTSFIYALNHWHRTPVGRRISPPNPVLTDKDRMPIEDLKALIGRRGRTITQLRPVGMCLFDGRRLECKSEQNVIEAEVEVECVGLSDRTLCVRPV